MTGNSVIQILTDLIYVIFKMLGRAVVQQQLLAIGLSLGVAWGLSRLIHRWLATHFPEHEPEPLEPEPVEAVLEKEGDEPLPPPTWRERLTAWLVSEVRELSYPIAALIVAYSSRALLFVWGQPAGLLTEVIIVLWLFLIYRLLLGVLYELLDRQRVHYYRVRLLGPAFGLLITLRLLALLTELSVLRGAVFFPNAETENPLTLGVVVFAVVGFFFWLVLTRALQDILQGIVTWRGRVQTGSFQATLIILRYVLIGVGLLIVFQVLQLDTTTIAAISGGLSIGVGFALQDVLKNFMGGLILLFDGTIRPGDWVEIAGSEGEVEKMSIRATIIRRLDNVKIIVPNQEWLISQVTTYTHTGRRTLAKVSVGVSYDSNVQQVRQLLIDTLRRHPEILPEPEPFVILRNFGESSLDFRMGGWVADATAHIRVTNELRLMVWDTFAEHDIEIPFPQRDLHIRSGVLSTVADDERRYREPQPDAQADFGDGEKAAKPR